MDFRIITFCALTLVAGCDDATTRPVDGRSATFQFGDVTAIATVENGIVHTELLAEDLSTRLFEAEDVIDYEHPVFEQPDFDAAMDLYLSEASSTTYLEWKQDGGEEDHLPIYLDCTTILFGACLTEICGSSPHGNCVDNFGPGCVGVAQRSCDRL